MPNKDLVRVRYAPSPTGLQHIGGIRTALFNYLFARNSGGRFILRIEDTDRQRSHSSYIQDLYQSLEWLGIAVDEGPNSPSELGCGPYVQSQRVELYRQYTRQLLDERKAYYCFCSSERLESLRKAQEQSKSARQGYDRHCRNLAPQTAQDRYRAGENCVVRFAIPLGNNAPLENSPVISFCDLLLGNIECANADLNPDPILLKADGFPTYHLANVIDDHLMQITHVLRAQEWLSSLPLHLLLYRAFGWKPPQFCHLPMVMGKDGGKLSKRHGATALAEFRNAGYLPAAVVNYIALLGWAFDDSREFFTLAELEQCFDLAKLSRSPATFDYQKLEWFNGQYIRRQSVGELRKFLDNIWAKALPSVYEPLPPNFAQSLNWILPLLQERLKFLGDAPAQAAYFFARPQYLKTDLEPNKSTSKKHKKQKQHSPRQTLELLQIGRSTLEQLCNYNWEWQDSCSLLQAKSVWEAAFRTAAETANVTMGALMQVLRYAITGSHVSPPLLESMLILLRLAGKAELLARIDQVTTLAAELENQTQRKRG